MNRRDFLVRVLGATTAALVLPKIEAISQVAPSALQESIAWQGTYAEIHAEASKLYHDLVERLGVPIRAIHDGAHLLGHSMLGNEGEPITLAHQNTVDLDAEDLNRSIEPAMRALAQRSAFYGIEYYGTLSLPNIPGRFEYVANRGPLRMIVARNYPFFEPIVRFDVLGGMSVAAERRAKARALRERLTRYPMPRFDPALIT